MANPVPQISLKSVGDQPSDDDVLARKTVLNVTVVRHAETDMNAQPSRVLQGQLDVPINAVGEKQASTLAWRLKKDHFDYIFTSDLQRAVQTTDEIKSHHPNATVTVDQRLREKDLGDLSGMTWADAKKMLKAEDQTLDQHLKQSGESSGAFEERVVGFYSDLIETYVVRPQREVMAKTPATGSLEVQLQREERRLSVITRSTAATPRGSLPSALPTPSRQYPPIPLPLKQDSPAKDTKLKKVDVLIVTHGGWINQLIKHIVEELRFEVDAVESNIRSFPKNTGVYKFSITKLIKRSGDYEWEGRVTNANSPYGDEEDQSVEKFTDGD
ncbi:hypothetical protein HDU96_002534 [Phlyctochytrium bullatum]|nr:hypothetical protein HDU96_002534 [Phlyctochytrium bullatum]